MQLIGGRYQQKGDPARGAMGDVWMVEDTKLGRTVALKFLARRRLSQQGALTEFVDSTVKMFEREGLAMARINHPHVAHIYDTGEHDGELYIVMEYVDGKSLAEHLKTGATLALEPAVRWTRQICEGLEAAHKAKVLHRDIKPDNIMITQERDVKIVDFGLAFLADVTQSQTTAGTPLYKAPERWSGEQGSLRSDLYSVGCVLYEMLTGRPPFGSPGDDVMAVGRMHQEDTPAPPSAHRPGVPPQLDSIVHMLLAKEPARRPESAQTVADAVREIQHVLDATGLGDAMEEADQVETSATDVGLSGSIRALDRRIFDLERRFGPTDQSVIEARAKHAEITGQSGDARGAVALYNRLGHDCQDFFGPYDVRALSAFEGVARWIAEAGRKPNTTQR